MLIQIIFMIIAANIITKYELTYCEWIQLCVIAVLVGML